MLRGRLAWAPEIVPNNAFDAFMFGDGKTSSRTSCSQFCTLSAHEEEVSYQRGNLVCGDI